MFFGIWHLQIIKSNKYLFWFNFSDLDQTFESTLLDIIQLFKANHVKLLLLLFLIYFIFIHFAIGITSLWVFWLILGYKLYRFNSTSNWIPKSTFCSRKHFKSYSIFLREIIIIKDYNLLAPWYIYLKYLAAARW